MSDHDVPNGYTPLCPQCGHWWMVAKEREGTTTALKHALVLLERTCTELQAERDEARAELARTQIALNRYTTSPRPAHAAERERDEARAELDAERDRLIGRIQELVALLRETDEAYRRTSHQGWCLIIESRSEADYQKFSDWRARLEAALEVL